MRVRSTTSLQIMSNLLILIFAIGTFAQIRSKIGLIFLENDRVADQQKVELYARAIRHSILSGDLVSVRSVLQSGLRDPSIRSLKFTRDGASEGICVDTDGSCYNPPDSDTHSTTVRYTLSFDGTATGQSIGELIGRFENPNAALLSRSISIYVGIAFCLLILFFNLVFAALMSQISKQVEWGIEAVRTLSTGGKVKVRPSIFVEQRQFQKSLVELEGVLSDYRDSVASASKREAFLQYAQDVGHNVLSPLTAAYAEAQSIPAITDEKRSRLLRPLRVVIDTIRDLQKRSKQTDIKSPSIPTEIAPRDAPIESELVSAIIESTVAEKRSELIARKVDNVDVSANLTLAKFGASAKVNPATFGQILSNLLNNAIEANASNVQISLKNQETSLVISVSDNGSGIPEEVLPSLGERGVSYGKPSGLGIGLSHAKQSLMSWGGKLEITSSPRKGTRVDLTLPEAPCPPWFPSGLTIFPSTTIVIVDDTKLVHETWKYRFGKLPDFKMDRISHHESVATAEEWIRQHVGESFLQNALYLVDYDLGVTSKNGLDLIEALGIQQQAILVTGRADDPRVISRCLSMGVRLLPKELIDQLPIIQYSA